MKNLILLCCLPLVGALLFISNTTFSVCEKGHGRVDFRPGGLMQTSMESGARFVSGVGWDRAAVKDIKRFGGPSLSMKRLVNAMHVHEGNILNLSWFSSKLDVVISAPSAYSLGLSMAGEEVLFTCQEECEQPKQLSLLRAKSLTSIGFMATIATLPLGTTVTIRTSMDVKIRIISANAFYLSEESLASDLRVQIWLKGGQFCLNYWRASRASYEPYVDLDGSKYGLSGYGNSWNQMLIKTHLRGEQGLTFTLPAKPPGDYSNSVEFVWIADFNCESDPVFLRRKAISCHTSTESTFEGVYKHDCQCGCIGCIYCNDSTCSCSLSTQSEMCSPASTPTTTPSRTPPTRPATRTTRNPWTESTTQSWLPTSTTHSSPTNAQTTPQSLTDGSCYSFELILCLWSVIIVSLVMNMMMLAKLLASKCNRMRRVARVQAGTPMVVIKPTTRSAFTKRDISSPIQNRPLPLPPTGFENLTFDSHSPHQSEREPANDGAKKGNKLNEKKHQVTKKKPESKAKEQTQHKNKQEDIMEEVEFEDERHSPTRDKHLESPTTFGRRKGDGIFADQLRDRAKGLRSSPTLSEAAGGFASPSPTSSLTPLVLFEGPSSRTRSRDPIKNKQIGN